MAARQGYPHACYQLGQLINANTNPTNPFGELDGLQHFLRASEMGHKKATEAVGRYHQYRKQYDEAVKYLLKAHSMVGAAIDSQGQLEHDIGTCFTQQ